MNISYEWVEIWKLKVIRMKKRLVILRTKLVSFNKSSKRQLPFSLLLSQIQMDYIYNTTKCNPIIFILRKCYSLWFISKSKKQMQYICMTEVHKEKWNRCTLSVCKHFVQNNRYNRKMKNINLFLRNKGLFRNESLF